MSCNCTCKNDEKNEAELRIQSYELAFNFHYNNQENSVSIEDVLKTSEKIYRYITRLS